MKASSDMKTSSKHNTKNYGELEIVEYVSCSNVIVKFTKTGFVTRAEAGDIRKGNVRDLLYPNIYGVGFFGIGDHKSSDLGVKTKAYNAWYNMMLRCYSTDEKARVKYKTYNECTVCDSWHNFQNFADWYYLNQPIGNIDYEIDKDLLSGCVKVYSPSTCVFISKELNISIAMEINYSLVDPSGTVHIGTNVTALCKEFNLSNGHISSVMSGVRPHHKGWRLHE